MITWTDWNNGDSLLLLRTNLNSFNNSAVTGVNSNTTDIAALKAPVSTTYTPQAAAPTYSKGRVFYNEAIGTLDVQGDFSDVTLQVGREMHMGVMNNTLAPIPNGTVCTQAGVLNDTVLIKPAIADNFDNARILGVTTHDIGVGEVGVITTFGEVGGVDTSGVAVGVPLYLSDTVAGTFTATPPDIVSRVGGALTSAIGGRLFVFVINNKNLPLISGGFKELDVPAIALTTTPQDFINYTTVSNRVVSADKATGILTLPNNGGYRADFTTQISFPTSTSTRRVLVEIYDVTNAAVLFTYIKNIPRDTTLDSFSFTYPLVDIVAGNQYKARVSSSTPLTVTFDTIAFGIESRYIV